MDVELMRAVLPDLMQSCYARRRQIERYAYMRGTDETDKEQRAELPIKRGVDALDAMTMSAVPIQ